MAVDPEQAAQPTVQVEPATIQVTGAPMQAAIPATGATITTPHGTITSATPFADPAGLLEQALGRVPMPWLLAWASVIGGAVLLFIGFIVVASIGFDNTQAHSILTAMGDKGWVFLAGLALPSPALAVARRL